MKNIKYFLAVITVFLLVLSCQDEEQFFEDSPDDSFTIEEARKWFESNRFPIMELTSSESEVFFNKSNNNEFKKRIKVLFQNQWKYAFKTKKKHIEAIEVPLKSNGWFSYSDKNSWDKWKQNKNYGYIRSITRLVIVNDREKETIKTFLMTIKGSSDYLERNNFRYGSNTYLKKEKDFEGMIFFHSLDGDFINGWQLYNGLIIGKISENIYSSKSIARKSDYTCTTYDVYANYETCSYAHTGYEENEEGALEAVWEFRGCETSEVWVDRYDVCEYNDEGEPVIDENYLEGGSNDTSETSDCDKLNTLINPLGANLKPSLDQLKTKVISQGENGVSYKKSNGVYSNSDLGTTYNNSIGIPTGGDNYSASHTHPDYTYPMFSWSDVYVLLKLYNGAKADVKDEVTLFLVSKENIPQSNADVYALTINDISAFRNQMQTDLNDIVNERPDLNVNSSFNDKVKALNDRLRGEYKGSNNIQRAFLDSFKGHSIALYKANNDLSSFSELSIPVSQFNESVDETPCN